MEGGKKRAEEGPSYHIYILSTGKYSLSLSYKHASGVVPSATYTVPICGSLKQLVSQYDRVAVLAEGAAFVSLPLKKTKPAETSAQLVIVQTHN